MNKETLLSMEGVMDKHLSIPMTGGWTKQNIISAMSEWGELCTAEMAEQLVKQLAEHKAQCAAKDAEIDRLEVELENVRLYFSLTEIEFDNLKINNNDKYL